VPDYAKDQRHAYAIDDQMKKTWTLGAIQQRAFKDYKGTESSPGMGDAGAARRRR
jgi:hypothetical protein